MIYVLDTNIIIHYLRKEPNVRQNFRNAVVKNCDIIIPRVVDYELQRGFCIASATRQEANYKLLLQDCPIIEMDVPAWRYAARIYESLYRKGLTVGELDILIGAYCLAKGYPLVTNNTGHFINMDGLKLVDWTKPTP